MSWRVVVRPEAGDDVAEAAEWYNKRRAGLGAEFAEEIMRVWDELSVNPLHGRRRHRHKHIRWRYPKRFPFRVIYEVLEDEHVIVVAAVLHAARHDRNWQRRL